MMKSMNFCPNCGKPLEAKGQKPFTFSDVPGITTGFDVKCKHCKWVGSIEPQCGSDYRRFIKSLERIAATGDYVPLESVGSGKKIAKQPKKSQHYDNTG
jgi:hypothetical protein